MILFESSFGMWLVFGLAFVIALGFAGTFSKRPKTEKGDELTPGCGMRDTNIEPSTVPVFKPDWRSKVAEPEPDEADSAV